MGIGCERRKLCKENTKWNRSTDKNWSIDEKIGPLVKHNSVANSTATIKRQSRDKSRSYQQITDPERMAMEVDVGDFSEGK